MISGPTRGATDERTWAANPVKAFAVRSLVAVVPLAFSYLAARVAASDLWRPDGWVGTAIFVLQLAVIGSGAAMVTDRLIRRLLPLASLLQMTLVFPDRAPSRFGLALRAGTLTKLAASTGKLSDDDQEAAEQLVAMVGQLGRHERLTRGHTERVRAYADLIGEELGLSDGDRNYLSWAAMSHDVGKLAVPPELLSKTEQPTPEEWEIIRTHPAIGAVMVEPLAAWLGPWRFAARDHHERWDGKGYPGGLAGDDISLAGRIVAVADAFDVITCNRSYKSALTVTAAREELVRCAGVQFDPIVVRALLQASLADRHVRFGLFGWFYELTGLSTLIRGVSYGVALTGAAAVVAIGTAGAPVDVDEIAVGPVSVAVPEVTVDLPFVAPLQLPDSTTSAPPEPVVEVTPSDPETIDPEIADQPEPTGVPSTTPVSSTVTTAAGTTSIATSTTAPQTTIATTTTTTLQTTTTTTTPTTTTTAPPTVAWEFASGGPGDTSSQAFLSLDGSLQNGTLPNYDTDRDSDPGLMIKKGDGLGESDLSKIQRWRSDAGGSRLLGWGTLTIFAATKDFASGKTGRFAIGLFDCDGSGSNCSALATQSASFDQANFGGNFGAVTVNFGSIDHTFASGRTLVLKLATASDSDDDLWFAYGTNTYPARLDID